MSVAERAISERQLQILFLCAEGYGNKEIAEKLGLSTFSVKNHLSIIYDTLGVRTRTEAVVRLWQLGLLR